MQQIGVGVKSGANVNKFEEMKLTKQKANFVSCPMINESPVSVECKVKEIKELGSHHMFIAEVLAIHADEKYIDKKGAFDISKCNLIAYSNGGYYLMGKKIGKFGFSVQKKKNQNGKKRENYKEKTNKNSKNSINKKYNKSTKEEKNNQNIVKKHIARKNKFNKK